jgi:DsbC/DsbD-like thiol-disulfide interchange protein
VSRKIDEAVTGDMLPDAENSHIVTGMTQFVPRMLTALPVLVLTWAVPQAWSGEAGYGQWADGHASRARLVAGPLVGSGQRIVGVQIELEPGWHTYWRFPGDSGVPPAFDWSGSVNAVDAAVEWPAPKSIGDDFGVSIGYTDEVVFPVVVTPERAGEMVSLALELDYAVCAQVCVPQSSALSLEIDPRQAAPSDAVALVTSYLGRVPHRQSGAAANPAIGGVTVARDDGGVVLLVEATGEAPAELYVEGPRPFFFSVARGGTAGAAGQLEFVVHVDGASAPRDLDGAELTATLVSANGAVERSLIVH